MRKTHIADDTCIIALAGIRTVSKKDTVNTISKEIFYIEVSYKSEIKMFLYSEKKERDAMYYNLKEALTEVHIRIKHT